MNIKTNVKRGGGQQPDQGARLERQCANITSVYLLSADPALVLLLFFFFLLACCFFASFLLFLFGAKIAMRPR